MSDQRKRPANLCTSDDNPEPKKRTVQKKTVGKWMKENDKEIGTSIWLKFETSTAARDHVTASSALFVHASRISCRR